jgi:hypothetical protein
MEAPAPAPTVYGVEVYEGDKKKEIVPFPDQGDGPK